MLSHKLANLLPLSYWYLHGTSRENCGNELLSIITSYGSYQPTSERKTTILCSASEHQVMHVLTQNDTCLSFRMVGPDDGPGNLSLPEIQTVCLR